MKKLIRLAGLMFCAIIIAAGAWIATEEAQAMSTTPSPAPDFDWYEPDRYNKKGPGMGTNKYLSETIPGAKAIGEVFVHGGNGKVDKETIYGLYGSTKVGKPVAVKCYVDNYNYSDTVTIQGQKIDEGWIISRNMQHLWNLAHSHKAGVAVSQAAMDKQIGWTNLNADAQEFFAVEGEKFEVVDYDDDWVYFWSTGTKAYTSQALADCSGWMLMNTHPAGFYKIARSDVWFHLYEEDEYVKVGDQSAGIGYTTTWSTSLYQEPGKIKAKAVYKVGTNSYLEVADAAPVKSVVEGDDTLYYRVMFVGSNDTYYMGHYYYYLYVDSRALNIYKGDKKGNIIEPEGIVKARITNTESSSYIAYSKKSTSSKKVNTLFQNGAIVMVDPANSDAQWAAVYINNRLAYIPADKLKYFIDEIKVVNVVDNKYVLSWGKIPAKVNAEFYNPSGSRIASASYGASVDSVKVGSDALKSSKYFSLDVKMVAKAAGSDDKAEIILKFPSKPSSQFSKRTVSNNQVTMYGTKDGAQVEYATNKSFKNAKKVKASKNYVTVKNLKKNTQYYFRYRNTLAVDTAKGKKTLYSDWSKTVAVKTTNITVKTPVLKKPIPGKNKVTLKWKKYTGNANSHELIVATDKKFTKNVKRGAATKSKCITEINGLKAKTKYYVKMRTVYNKSGQTYYSAWTKVKSFKTK